MMFFLTVLLALLFAVEAYSLSIKNGSEHTENSYSSELPGCYNKFVNSKGSVQNLVHADKYSSSMVCEWDIDVTRGFVVELEFEILRLPINEEHNCDSYLQISYSPTEDEVVKRLICPADMVEKICTGSQTVRIYFKPGAYPKEHGNATYGFKINYRAVTVNRVGGTHVFTVIILSFATVFIIALVFFFIRRRKNKSSGGENVIPNSDSMRLQPNAPTRAELQTAFERERRILQAPQMEQKYLSRTSSVNSKVPSEKIFENRPPHALVTDIRGKARTSIGSTPHLVPNDTRKKWNSEVVKSIRKLRTRLEARFPSHASSEVSVFFEAADRRTYSQLDSEDGNSPEEPPKGAEPDPKPKPIPSFVIELVD